MEPSCPSTNILESGRTRSLSSSERFSSSGSHDTISVDVAVAHGKGCMVDFAASDDPAYAVGSAASPRDDVACVALEVCLKVVHSVCSRPGITWCGLVLGRLWLWTFLLAEHDARGP